MVQIVVVLNYFSFIRYMFYILWRERGGLIIDLLKYARN